MKMYKFELNGVFYETDLETLEILRGTIPSSKESKDGSAVIAMMEFGLLSGRIKEMKEMKEAE